MLSKDNTEICGNNINGAEMFWGLARVWPFRVKQKPISFNWRKSNLGTKCLQKGNHSAFLYTNIRAWCHMFSKNMKQDLCFFFKNDLSCQFFKIMLETEHTQSPETTLGVNFSFSLEFPLIERWACLIILLFSFRYRPIFPFHRIPLHLKLSLSYAQ